MKLPEKLQFAPNGDSENIYNMLLKINAIIEYLEQYEQPKPKEKKESKWVSRTIKRPNWFNK